MRHLILLMFSVACTSVFSYEHFSDESSSYFELTKDVDSEINELLTISEKCLFSGNFIEALRNVQKVDGLLSLIADKNGHQKMRLMFDEAVIITCIEGPTENSYRKFADFNDFLDSKMCSQSKFSEQPDLFDANGHWPIVNDGPISIEECLERVEKILQFLQDACDLLPIHDAARIALKATIYAIGEKAKRCCTQNGFWITCIQPVVDAWKQADVFGIPPDPCWD